MDTVFCSKKIKNKKNLNSNLNLNFSRRSPGLDYKRRKKTKEVKVNKGINKGGK